MRRKTKPSLSFLKAREIPSERFWSAYISPQDELLKGKRVPKKTLRVTIVSFGDVPVFGLFGDKQICSVTPYDILFAFANDRIAFESKDDREEFCEVLLENLNRYDAVVTMLSKIRRVAMVAAGITIAAISCVAGVVMAKRKIFKQ